MTNKEIFDGLRLIVKTYISEHLHQELLGLLSEREALGDFPPGKGIIASVDSDSNGVPIKQEHKKLWSDLCHHCI
ncbi:MAG: hypothetical protein GY714_21780 [Desulfobacterales bacterium]|nr:hypothetical protein [Desulfobacterales bacterium]